MSTRPVTRNAVLALARAHGGNLRNRDLTKAFGCRADSARRLLKRYRVIGLLELAERGVSKLTRVGWDYHIQPTMMDRLLRLAETGEVTLPSIASDLGVTRNYAHVMAVRLCARGLLERVARGRYRLVVKAVAA